MRPKRLSSQMWGIIFSGFLLTNCAPSLSKGPKFFLGEANQNYRTVNSIQALEKSNPEEAIKAYKEYLEGEGFFTQSFTDYQEYLQEALPTLQSNSRGSSSLPEEAGLGFPNTFNRSLQALVATHQGLGRAYMVQGNYAVSYTH